MAPKHLRRFIFETLLSFERAKKTQRIHLEDGLDAGYRQYDFSSEDRALGTFLAYGVLRQWFRLQSILQTYSQLPVEKLTPAMRLLLKLGLFQLAWMDSIPDHAAVASTLSLAEETGFSKKSRGYLNGILRTFIRNGKPAPSEENAWPAWWKDRLAAHFSPQDVAGMLTAYGQTPLLSLRINTLNISTEAYQHQLNDRGIAFVQSTVVPEVLQLTGPCGNPTTLPGYAEGHFTVQDESAALVAHWLDPQPGETIVELGAAPGTKTTHIAAKMQNRGRILAVDPSEKRMLRLKENTQRLGVQIIEPIVADGAHWQPDESITVDSVLIDAPCTGTGVMNKHPEILLALKPDDFTRITSIQEALLLNGLALLKPGGILIYATCSIDPAENEAVIQSVLSKTNNAYLLLASETLLPNAHRDGFYMAKLARR